MASHSQQRPFTQTVNAFPVSHAVRRHAYSPGEMARLLDRERDRTDRTGTPFAMVVFLADDGHARREVHAALLRVLATRLRISDEFGRLDRWRVAAVLPATPPAGAWTVADDICLRLPHDLPLPQCEVYAYPGEQAGTASGGEHIATGMASEPGTDGNGKDATGLTGNGDGERHTRQDELHEGKRALRQGAVSGPVRPLEPLFIRPLPWSKRLVDLVVASLALIALSPLLLLTSLAIKFTSPGPVLFRQMRSGLGGRPFVLYKFRSMVYDAEAKKADLLALNEQDGPAFKIRHDPRITALGLFLRATSLDEFPQLWNVLRGDMSLVGPRPLPCDESDACTGWHRRRLDVTPGLTCIWQVEGRSSVSFDDWVRMDIRYVRLRSLVKDATLMLRTMPAMLLRKGV